MKNNRTEKIVYFVRHGQSEANVSSVFQSEDSPLTAVGKQQAELIAERVAKLSFEALLSSPYSRAKETARAICDATKKPVEYSELFVERVKPSSVSGRSHEDAEAARIYEVWEKSLYASGVKVEDGENFDGLVERADEALRFLTGRPERELVVVTHGFFLRTIIARVLLGESFTAENFRNFQYRSTMENTGLSALKYIKGDIDTRWRLWIYNDHAHLG